MHSNINLSKFEKKYDDGDILFCEYETGDRFYFIKKGEVKLLRMVDGSERMVDVLRSGVFFGEMAIIESEPRSAMAVASGEVIVLEFLKNDFEGVILQNPQLSLWLIQTFVTRIMVQQQRFQIYSYKDFIPRVIMSLFNLKILIKSDSIEKKYVVQASIDDITKWVGIPQKDTKSILQTFSNEKLIVVEKERIIIINDAGLQRKLAMFKKVTTDP